VGALRRAAAKVRNCREGADPVAEQKLSLPLNTEQRKLYDTVVSQYSLELALYLRGFETLAFCALQQLGTDASQYTACLILPHSPLSFTKVRRSQKVVFFYPVSTYFLAVYI
jgi:hypothetical protein